MNLCTMPTQVHAHVHLLVTDEPYTHCNKGFHIHNNDLKDQAEEVLNDSPVDSDICPTQSSDDDHDPFVEPVGEPEPVGGDPPLPADGILPPIAPLLPPPPDPAPLDPIVDDGSQAPNGYRPLGVRGNASYAWFVTAHGKVTCYGGKYLEAVCRFPGHGDCRVTRSCKAPTGARLISHRHQGRQAACLVAWLEVASAAHNSSSDHKKVMPAFPARRAVRDRLKNGGANALALLAGERDKFDFEPDSEPSDFDPFEM